MRRLFTRAALIASALLLLATPLSAAPDPNTDMGAVITLSAQGAGTVNSGDLTNTQATGLKCLVDVTAISGTSPTLTVAIQYKDTASGLYTALLTSASITATGTKMLTVYPGVAVTANVSASDVMPRTFDVTATIGGTSPSVTGTVGCTLLY